MVSLAKIRKSRAAGGPKLNHDRQHIPNLQEDPTKFDRKLCDKKTEKKKSITKLIKMSRLFSKSLLLAPSSLASAPLRGTPFKFSSSPAPTSRVPHRMATDASSSPPSATGGDATDRPVSNAGHEPTTSPSSSSSSTPASSAIDFLSLCHRLKVIEFVNTSQLCFVVGNGFWIVWFRMSLCCCWLRIRRRKELDG